MERVYPRKAGQLNVFLPGVSAIRGNREGLARAMEETQTEAVRTRERIQQSELRTFFARGIGADDLILGEFATTTDPLGAFRQIFRSRESVGTMEALMDRVAQADPATREILEADIRTAYAKHLRDALLTRTEQSGGIRAVSPRNIDQAADETTQLFAVGDVIYQDRPEFMEAIVLRPILRLVRRKAAPSPASSPHLTLRQPACCDNVFVREAWLPVVICAPP